VHANVFKIRESVRISRFSGMRRQSNVLLGGWWNGWSVQDGPDLGYEYQKAWLVSGLRWGCFFARVSCGGLRFPTHRVFSSLGLISTALRFGFAKNCLTAPLAFDLLAMIIKPGIGDYKCLKAFTVSRGLTIGLRE